MPKRRQVLIIKPRESLYEMGELMIYHAIVRSTLMDGRDHKRNPRYLSI